MTSRTARLDAGRSAAKGPVARAGDPLRRLAALAGLLPFATFVSVFLLWPTLAVVFGAFRTTDGGWTFANVAMIASPTYLETFLTSIVLSALTAGTGAVFGALLAWAISAGPREGPVRRMALAGSATLAQFGGVMLAFAFLATFGFNGLLTLFLYERLGIDLFAFGAWIYEMPGLVLVYSYFQIPLMVIVFLPAIEGLRPQWREACSTLGGSGWTFWRHVGFPILWPSFLGSALLLFANAFSAYATAKALISQASPLVPLRIGTFLTSEIVLDQAQLGQALAFGMIVIVAVVTGLYAALQRRTARWLR